MNIWDELRKRRKHELAEMQIEFLLSQGKTVIRVRPERTEVLKRRKHLTCIEKYEQPKGTLMVGSILDEWHDE